MPTSSTPSRSAARRFLLASAALVLVAPPVAAQPVFHSAPAIRVLSSDADKVTGGDALVEVTVHNASAARRLRVALNGVDVTGAFAEVSANRFLGLVQGLAAGRNTLIARGNQSAATPPGQSDTLAITNHPISGPVFSGPQQQPFFCQTETAGLGPAQDANCFAPTQVVYRYRTTAGTFAALANPADRPADLATLSLGGQNRPYIVRLERGVINRGLYEIAAIHDGIEPNPLRANEAWNGKLVLTYGGGGNVGYRQGTATGGVLLHDALSRGFVVASNSLMVAQTAAHFVRNAETAMMVKERVIERYGPLRHTIGFGGSGGSIMQYLAAHAYPGILDGILPSSSFPDSLSPQMALDCTLLVRYLGTPQGTTLTTAQRQAISGMRNFGSCQFLGVVAANAVSASGGCDAIVPAAIRYNAVTNPTGVRCTQADSWQALLGLDPQSGFVEPTFDNDGLQYGLQAFQSGALTAEQFVHLNERIGGFDRDSVMQAARSSVSARNIERAHATGLLSTTLHLGGQAYTPAIDLRRVTDDILDIHPSLWSNAAHERLVRDGVDARIHSRWIWAPNDARPHFAEAIDAMDSWLDAIAADLGPGTVAEKAVRNRPASATDRCWSSAIAPASTKLADCTGAFPPVKDTRIVAGAPTTGDVIWCNKKPLNPRDYPVELSSDQWQRLRTTFPNGVCDFSQPNRAAVPFAGPWQSYR